MVKVDMPVLLWAGAGGISVGHTRVQNFSCLGDIQVTVFEWTGGHIHPEVKR